MQLESFHKHSHHEPLCHALQTSKCTRDILGGFYKFSFYSLGMFLIRQLFHSHLLDMRSR